MNVGEDVAVPRIFFDFFNSRKSFDPKGNHQANENYGATVVETGDLVNVCADFMVTIAIGFLTLNTY